MNIAYMLDTNICSFIMRERSIMVRDRLRATAERQDRVVVSVITYYELLLGTIGSKASPRHANLVEAFVARLSDILPWSRAAAEEATQLRKDLAAKGTPIGANDAMIAGHAMAAGCALVTNNTREFGRVKNLVLEDWTVA